MLREFKNEDWIGIKDAVEPFMPHENLEEFFKEVEQGLSIAAVDDGIVMAVGGIVIETDTEGTVWCKVSKKCLAKSIKWSRIMKETFGLMLNSVGDLTISTYILKGFCRGDGLARLIGLENTGKTETRNGNTYYKYTAVI